MHIFEFLILVIAVVGGIYFVSNNVDRLLPEHCVFPPEVVCKDFEIITVNNEFTEVSITLSTNGNRAIVIDRWTFTADEEDPPLSCTKENQAVKGSFVTLKCELAGTLKVNTRSKIQAEVIYKQAGGTYGKSLEGSLNARVIEGFI